MAGQGFLLANLAYSRARVWLGDINPALCLFATLRSPEAIRSAPRIGSWLEQRLRAMPIQPSSHTREYVDEWIPRNIKEQLQAYRALCELKTNPFESWQAFSRAPLTKRFAAALPLLTAREIACYRSSDNHTWIKPGGLQRAVTIVEPLRRALQAWLTFAHEKATEFEGALLDGQLSIEKMNAAAGEFGLSPRVDAVITSPPYANRLDYTRMWGPESEVAAAMWDADIKEIQSAQIGSNIIRGSTRQTESQQGLPKQILDALSAIRNDADYASESYYYPFFRNYALSLAGAVRQLADRVKTKGVLVAFVRDTVRKDVLFPTGILIEKIMQQEGFRTVGKERKIVRRHVGLRRKGAARGLYGVGQQEWWLAFRRSGR